MNFILNNLFYILLATTAIFVMLCALHDYKERNFWFQDK